MSLLKIVRVERLRYAPPCLAWARPPTSGWLPNVGIQWQKSLFVNVRERSLLLANALQISRQNIDHPRRGESTPQPTCTLERSIAAIAVRAIAHDGRHAFTSVKTKCSGTIL